MGLGCDRIFQNLAVGTVGDLAHILHTLVTHLDVVLVDQFGGLLFRNDSMIFINSFPICVSTLVLNGGLNQVIFLDLVLFLRGPELLLTSGG